LHRTLVVAMTFAVAAAASAQNYETLSDLKASALAVPALLKGPYHTVDEKVTLIGPDPNFTIRSKYGTWEARGREMLAIRVSELPAFEAVEKVSKTDEFAKAAAKALAAPVKTAGELIVNPVQTTGNIVSGIGMMVGRVARTAGSAVANVG